MDDAARWFRAFLDAAGLADDPELAGTPERVTELLASFAPKPLPAPSICATASSTPVVIRGIPFHSLCAHHLLPFFGEVSVAYRPEGRLLGLGSVPRLVAHFARRTQIQERMAEQIADGLAGWAAPVALAVAVRARHLCVEMRGTPAPVEVTVIATRGEPDAWLRSQVER
ncbi:MAG: GTP cyclohydrolase I [Myxococcota bacterium]